MKKYRFFLSSKSANYFPEETTIKNNQFSKRKKSLSHLSLKGLLKIGETTL